MECFHCGSTFDADEGFDCPNCGTCNCDDCRYDRNRDEWGCDCEAPELNFTFPVNGRAVPQNELVTVESGIGRIGESALSSIGALIRDYTKANATFLPELAAGRYANDPANRDYWALRLSDYLLTMAGNHWSDEDGRFTRRISRYWHQQVRDYAGWRFPQKLDDATLTQIGNLANEGMCNEPAYSLAFTRDLNLPPDEFAHGDSCWWGSYYESRCIFKQSGGIGLRSFSPTGYVTGRAWIMPIVERDDISPATQHVGWTTVHSVERATALAVFNGYEALGDGSTAATLVSKMTGWTNSTRVAMEMGNMYINGASAVLLSPVPLTVSDSIGVLPTRCR